MARRVYKTVTIPAAKQAGACSGFFPIDLSGDADIQAGAKATGRNVFVTDADGNVLRACLLPKRHVAAANGVWTWFTQPTCIYDASAEKTLVGYVTPQGGRHVAQYDHQTDKWSDFQLSTTDLEGDDHNNPAFCVRSDGKYLAVYTEHNNSDTLKMRISSAAGDATAWDAEYTVTPTPEGVLTYVQLWRLSAEDKIYLFGRHDGADGWYLITSDDDGATWSAPTDFMRNGTFQIYPRFWCNGVDKIRILATKKENNVAYPNGNKPLYSFYYDGSWRQMDGTAFGSFPIVYTQFNESSIIAEDSGDDSRWVGDITEDGDGTVHVLYYQYPAHDETDHDLYHAVYDPGFGWSSEKIMDEGGPIVPEHSPSVSYPGVAVFDPLDAARIAVGREVAGIRELEIWKNTDGTWSRETQITHDSLTNNFRPNFAYGRVSGVSPHLFWCGAGKYDGYEEFELCILAYPAAPAAGVLVRLDLDGETDKVLRLYYSDEDEDLLSPPSAVAAGMGAIDLFVGGLHLRDNRHAFVNAGRSGGPISNLNVQIDSTATVFAGVRFGQVGSDNSSRQIIRPQLAGSFRVAVLAVVDWDTHPTSPLNSAIVSNNAAEAGIISRLVTASGAFQFFVVLSSGTQSITSTTAVPRNTPTLVYGEHDRVATGGTLKVRVGEIQETAAGAAASLSSTAAETHAIGQEKSSGTVAPLQGVLPLVGLFDRTLPKAYTDTLSRAFADPATFATIDDTEVVEIGEIVTVNKPSTGEPIDEYLAKDFDLQITAATASTSRLLVTVKRCNNDAAPDIELDSATGLLSVEDVESPTAADGSVTRDSDSQVSVHIDADAFDHLKPGLYHLELYEITLGGRVISRHQVDVYFSRAPGRVMS